MGRISLMRVYAGKRRGATSVDNSMPWSDNLTFPSGAVEEKPYDANEIQAIGRGDRTA